MKKFLAGVATLAMVAGGATSAMAQVVTSNGASATLEQALVVTAGNDLAFGVVSVDGTAGTVVVDPAGAATFTGGAISNDASQTAAVFDIVGPDGAAYNITLPASATLSGPTSTITVDNFVSAPDATTGGTLTGGVGQVTVGATLQVAASQVQEAYTGTFDVTIDIP